MSKGEFYKMDYESWDTGTVDLTLEQEAAYLRLCHQMYRSGGPIPDSTRLLQGLFRCGHVKAAALLRQLEAAGKIQRTPDGLLTNYRVSQELLNRESLSTKRRLSGELGGTKSGVTRANPLKTQGTDEANASASRTRGEERREESPLAPQGDGGVKAEKPKASDLRDPIASMVGRLFKTFPEFAAQGANAGLLDTSPLVRLVAAGGCDLELDVEATITGILARKPKRPPNSWSYFRQPIERARDERLASIPAGTVPAPAVTVSAQGVLVADPDGVFRVSWDDQGTPRREAVDHPDAERGFWPSRIAPWVYQGAWSPRIAGPAPGEPGCIVPVEVLERAMAWKAEHAEERRRLRESADRVDDMPSTFGKASPRPVSTHH